MKYRWLWQMVIAVDQLVNAFFGGYADETLSSRAYRQHNKKWYWRILRRVIDVIFFFEKNHCEEAYMSELIRRHLPNNFYEAQGLGGKDATASK